MATPQLSPGVIVREVDLTVGRVENVLDNIGAIAGPFAIGPVGEVIEVSTENDLIESFGKPISTDGQYKYWLSASSFLSYGGILKVVRIDDPDLKNANVVSGAAHTTSLKINNFEAYNSILGEPSFIFAAQTPGTWANGLKVAFIDDKADQKIGINTTNLGALSVSIGSAIVSEVNGLSFPNTDGTQGTFSGYIKGIVTGLTTSSTGNSSIDVKIVSTVSGYTKSYIEQPNPVIVTQQAGIGTTRIFVNSIPNDLSKTLSRLTISQGINPPLQNLQISGIGTNYIDLTVGIAQTVEVSASVTNNRLSYSGGTEVKVTYKEGDSLTSIPDNSTLSVVSQDGIYGKVQSIFDIGNCEDWFSTQTIALSTGTIFWSSIAPKPTTTTYTNERNGVGDAMHIAVFDDTGSITGIKGNLIEKHLSLSKARDARSTQIRTWWRDYLSRYSSHIYGGEDPSDFADNYRGVIPANIAFESGTNSFTGTGDLWNKEASNSSFKCIGNVLYALGGGNNYTSDGGYLAGLDSIITGYRKFENKDEVAVDYLIMGPSLTTKIETQSKANYLISLAESRKDCMAVISPHEDDVVNIPNSETQTNNIISFFAPLSGSSYAVFDSGYKYTYDRFTGTFVYIPCNPDIAGLMVRTALNSYPWFSPAGQQRGVINNAVKLAYNPTKNQRDRLYSQRINPVVTQSGVGTILFGDKTALSFDSAFDRINVRRLFLTVEQAIESAAKAQLFELNDEVTRANFINIIEPYFRDIQAKRGIYDFLLVCDATNNTPDIIDNNEFRADIYLKPTKSINYITVTFVATRTGVSFEEVAGRV
jgi:hypothetical protein